MDIYIKPVKKAIITGKDSATIEDVAKVVSSKSVTEDLNKCNIFKRDNKNESIFLISVIDIICVIKRKYPNYTINNVGETNVVIEFKEEAKKENHIFKLGKILFVTSVLLTGCATAIITFHADSQLNQIFDSYKKMFFGEGFSSPLLMEIPYSVGVAVGIMVFFNHFAGKKITNDPTPIEVEMSTYEASVLDTVIETLEANEKEGS